LKDLRKFPLRLHGLIKIHMITVATHFEQEFKTSHYSLN